MLSSRSSLSAWLMLAAPLLLSACALSVTRPSEQQPAAAQGVVSELRWWSLFSAPFLSVRVAPWSDGEPTNWTDVTGQYQFAPTTSGWDVHVGRAELALPAGRYKLRAQGCWSTAGPWGAPTLPWDCRQQELSFQAVAAGLQLGSLPAAVDAGSTLTVSVQAGPPPGRDLAVTVVHPGLASGQLTLPTDGAAPQTVGLQAQTAGSGTLVATAPAPYGTAQAALAVRPRLDALSAPSGEPGEVVTLSGEGFVAPLQVLFGNAATVNVTPASRQQVQVQIPAGLAPAALTLRVRSNGQLSSAQPPFTVLPASIRLFRSHPTGVETLRFTPAGPSSPAAFALVTPASVAAESAGMNVVGLRREGNVLLRASANALEAFTIGGTPASPTLVRSAVTASTGSNSAAASGNGADAAFLPGAWVRGTDRGLEVYTPGTGTLRWSAQVANRPTLTVAGVALLAYAPGRLLLRSTASTLEPWDLSALASPQLGLPNNAVFAAPMGQGLDWLDPGQRLVRNFQSGVQRVDFSNGVLTPVANGHNSGGGSSPYQTLLVLPDGKVARSDGLSVEIYDLSFGPTPVRCAASPNGASSSGGVALAAQGKLLFRATSEGIEAWDLSALVCTSTPMSGTLPAPLPFRSGLQPAATGLGLAL